MNIQVFLIFLSYIIVISNGQSLDSGCLQPGIRSGVKQLSIAESYPEKFRMKFQCHSDEGPIRRKQIFMVKQKKFIPSNDPNDIMVFDSIDDLKEMGMNGSSF